MLLSMEKKTKITTFDEANTTDNNEGLIKQNIYGKNNLKMVKYKENINKSLFQQQEQILFRFKCCFEKEKKLKLVKQGKNLQHGLIETKAY